MRPNEPHTNTENPGGPPSGATLALQLPLGDADLFRFSASEEILDFLALHPDIEVSTRRLAELVDFSEKAVRSAVDALEGTSLVETRREGNRRLVSVARENLTRPDDPVEQMAQPEFRLPTRIALHEIRQNLDDVLGVVLFGSVARGEATPQSDIDLWVLVEADRQQQLHEANQIAKRLSGLQIPPKVAIHRRSTADITPGDLDEYLEMIEADEGEWSSVPAPDYEIIVETPQGALNRTENISAELFVQGITLEDSETLRRVREEVVLND
jgi:predicted nucleotidyltransferase